MDQKAQRLFDLNNLLNNEKERVTARTRHQLVKLRKQYNDIYRNEVQCSQFWTEICENSNMHGLKFVGIRKGHCLERIFFGILFVFGILGSVYLILEAYKKYQEFPTFITFRDNEVKVDQIPFPAISICNVNNMRRTKAHEFVKKALHDYDKNLTEEEVNDARRNVFMLHNVCESTYTSFSSKFQPKETYEDAEALLKMQDIINGTESSYFRNTTSSDDIKRFIKEVTQPCDEMILLCLWEDHEHCKGWFTEIITDYGKCCTFNMAPSSRIYTEDIDEIDDASAELLDGWSKTVLHAEDLINTDSRTSTSDYPKRVKRSGMQNGLSILLNPDIEEFYCTAADSFGFQIATHLPMELPQVAEFGEAISPDTENFVKIKADLTIAHDDIAALDPAERNCYFKDEKRLEFFQPYTQRNCLAECASDLTFDVCDCIQYYMPGDDRPLCSHADFGCVKDIQRDMIKKKWIISDFCKDCRPTCADINYEVEISSRIMSDEEWAGNKDIDSSEWKKNKVSIVHIFFEEDSTYPKLRKRLFGTIDKIANIGGLLGLCLGFSIISGVEVIYLFIVRVLGKSYLLCKSKTRQEETTESKDNQTPKEHYQKRVAGKITPNQPLRRSERVITRQPTYNAASHLPNFFPDELAPRFASSRNLKR